MTSDAGCLRGAESVEVEFAEGHNGPPGVVQGGTLAGRMADVLGGPAEVTLRRPAPLRTPLQLERHGSTATLRLGKEVFAGAMLAEVSVEVPAPPSFATAEAASRAYLGHTRHPFPTCWVCGTKRAPGDGMRIFAGAVQGTNTVAALWTPDASLTAAHDLVEPVFLWAALDCPGGWAAVVDMAPRPVVLGRIAARVDRPVHAGIPYIVMAWKLATEGRKHHVGSAIFTAGGVTCAVARAIWFDVDAEEWS